MLHPAFLPKKISSAWWITFFGEIGCVMGDVLCEVQPARRRHWDYSAFVRALWWSDYEELNYDELLDEPLDEALLSCCGSSS